MITTMKTIARYIALFGLVFGLAACDSMLDTAPEGATKTESQKQDAFSKNPSTSAADISAMYAQMIQLFAGLGEDDLERHYDFGYASMCIMRDCMGQDYVRPNIGYNWFASAGEYSDRVYTSQEMRMHWREYYKIIRAANAVIGGIDSTATDATLRANLGQARAVRAFCYLEMAQLYQFTYSDATKNLPCVPIVTEQLTSEQSENNPRATVQQVYDLVLRDLNYSVSALAGFNRADKGYVNQAVALGLRARANLALKNWAAAASDADSALIVSGASIYTREEVSKPTFCSAGASSVLWANILTESNDVVSSGIVNWQGHVSSFYTQGYTSVGAYSSISSTLYAKISDTDVRKGWWLNEQKTSPLLDNAAYSWWKETAAGDGMEYVNVKWGLANDNSTSMTAAADWILMRAEEMLLIKAEGLARSGDEAGARAALAQLTAERDPQYRQTESNLLDEIWFQRRIELWGEGFAFFDILRLEKTINRKSTNLATSNWPAAWQYTIQPNDPVLLFLIPSVEIEANQGISNSDNNQQVATPTV